MDGMDGMGWLSLEGAIYRAPTVLIRTKWQVRHMLQAFFGYFSVGTSKYRRDLRLGEKKSIKSAKGTTNGREAF